MPTSSNLPSLDALSRPGGGFAMMALDGRESMRAILRDAGLPIDDDSLSSIKSLIARVLGGEASAVLCDPLYGLEAARAIREDAPGTGLIMAVDHFDEPTFGPLQDAWLDEAALATLDSDGVAALKLYLYWRPDADRSATLEQARRFAEGAHERGMLALLEGVVPLPGDDPRFNDALVEAAAEFSQTGADVYKTQAPGLGRIDLAEVTAVSARITDAIGIPWVVLSNGVPDADYPRVVAAVCDGGASGFLAGRGVWRAAVESGDPEQALLDTGVARIRELADVVDRHARSWRAV